jgi:hypothetical protein
MALTALHLLKPDMSPSRNMISHTPSDVTDG